MEHQSLAEYLESLHKLSSAKSYHFSIVKFLTTNPEAEQYGYQDIVNYLLELKKQKLSDTYRSKVLASIKKYYDYLIYIEVRKYHPCRRLHIKDGRKKGLNFEELFTADELELLLTREERYRYLGHRNKFLISLLIYQGLASSELVKLTVQDIDLDDATINIKASRQLSGRILPMHRTQVMLASLYLEDSREFLIKKGKPTNKLFITKLGASETVDGIHAMLEPLKGLFPHKTLNPKTVRMSVIANWLNERKLPLEDVQLMAGHKWPSSTERYKRANLEEQRRLINQFHPLSNLNKK